VNGAQPRAPTQGRAETDPSADDPHLRGRTYAIPFDRVWTATLGIVHAHSRWSVVDADDLAGVVRCESTTLVLRRLEDVFIRISLDENAQTRVDLISRSREDRRDWGSNARRIRWFVKKLDRALDASPDQILDPTIPVPWSVPDR